ncbi:translocation/assembly module TamB [Mannheimia sp. AT1]|uniref:Translocation/assembly module TamB n=1 Tax=Mannheimia cairinae TaxID=3025936 RepID=A0ABT5MLG4_9PAST|nr:translocation/assembly module TamB domain-containing protein [Mannheimia cairinae]MDD0823038.1 translocation/assembly module TamB [Mannheimia cairinae]MDD0825937.1 translocation/assembly module TamB [Mannheimia cairinae]
MNEEKKQTTETEISLEQSEQTEKAPKKQRKTAKLRVLWCGLTIFLFTLLCLILFLFTGYGQRKTLELVDRFVEPLQIGQIEGSIQEGLTLTDAQFMIDGVNVQVGKAELHIGFNCLLDYEVCLNNVSLKDTSVVVDTTQFSPSEEKKESEPFTELRLPLGISAKNIELENIDVKVDDMDIHLNHFQTALSGKGRTITIKPTTLDGLDLLLALKLEEEAQAVDFSEENATSETLTPTNAQDIADKVVKEAAVKTGEKVAERFQELQGKNVAQAQQENDKVDWAAIQAQLEKPFLDKQSRINLPLDLIIEKIDISNVALSQKAKDEAGNFIEPISLLNVESLQFQAQAKEQKVEVTHLDLKSDQGDLTATGSLLLKDDYPLEWRLEGNEAVNANVKLPFDHAKATLSGELYNTTMLTLKTEGAINAALSGQFELAEPKMPFDLSLESESMSYPFAPQKNEEVLKLENIDIQLKGNLLQYNTNIKVKAQGMGVPASSANLEGKGELTHFEFQQLELNTLEGKATLSGSVDWTEGVEWDSQLTVNNINTKSLVADWPAILSGTLNSKGYAGRGESGTDWKADVSTIDINGSLFQKNLQLKGELTANNQQLLNVPALSLVYGENKIDVKGILGEKSDFYADIKAPNLQGLVPNLKANINGNVKLSGKVVEPNIDLDLTAANVSYDQLKLQNLTAKGVITTEKSIQGDLELGLRQFSYNDIKIDSATLIAKGNEENHTLKLTSKGNPVGADLQISGKFNRLQEVWEGQLSQVAIQSTDFGKFQTDKAVNVKYDNKSINANISAHCWHNPKINLCFPSAFNAGEEGKVPFDIRNFNLAVLQPYLDKDSQITGIVNAKGDAAWFKNKQPEVNVELTSNSLKFVQKMEGSRNFPLTVSPLKIQLKMADNNLTLKSDLKVENNGKLSTDLVMRDLNNARTLSGNIHIDQLTLRLIRPLLDRGDSVDGNINARLTVGGSVTSPLLNGNLNLTNLKVRSVTMPFDITGGNLAMNFHGATSTLTGRVQTNNQSELKLEGDADWRDLNAWKTRVHAQANRFRVDVPNIAKVAISPDIQVIATPTLLTLSGNIDLPWARIEVEELPESAVSVSGDEVIMDGSAKTKVPFNQRNIPAQTSGGMAINADIKINIGNDVKLKAYGLNSDVKGLLSVRQGRQGLGLYGQVHLENGRFAAYGQDLLIRKGNVSFAGSPSQPTLDIEAIRNPEAMEDSTITAGVRVTGLADNPNVKVFSDPAMSQNEALSYILTGRSLETSGDAGSSNAVAAALLSMSLSKSSKLVGDVGSTFGLKDLSVSTAGIGDNTKVEVSASLSPRFRVKYGVGIFAPLTELTLRYNLTPRLYLQWVSSINQAVDLMYRFEFDELF